MKKILLVLLVLLTVSGCGKKERTFEYLMDGYVEAYTKANIKAVYDIFPPFYVEYAKDNLTQESLEKIKKTAEELFGEGFTIEYEVTNKIKYTDEELKTYNEKVAKKYNTKEEATECYKIEGDAKFKGPKKEQKDSLSIFAYCKYNDVWYIVNK